jgi:MFS family permease
MLLGFRLTDRVGKGIRSAPRDALICDLAPEKKRGLAFGIQRGMDHAGAVIGPLIASALLTLFLLDLKTMFLFSYIPGIIAVLIVIFGVKEIKKEDHVRLEEFQKFQSGQYFPGGQDAEDKTKKPSVLFFKDFNKLGGRFNYLLSIFIIFTLGNSTDAFLLLRASDLGIQLAYIPLLWSILHLSKTLFSLLGGYLSDKTGRKKIIGLGWSVYLLTYIGFAFADSMWQIWALFAFYGIFFGFTEGVEKALVGDMVAKKTRGLAYGYYNFAIGIAALPASIVFGLVWKIFSFRLAFIMGAGISLAALIMLAFLKIPVRKQL